jgi:hypothetical protein
MSRNRFRQAGNQFLGSLKSYNYGLWDQTKKEHIGLIVLVLTILKSSLHPLMYDGVNMTIKKVISAQYKQLMRCTRELEIAKHNSDSA